MVVVAVVAAGDTLLFFRVTTCQSPKITLPVASVAPAIFFYPSADEPLSHFLI